MEQHSPSHSHSPSEGHAHAHSHSHSYGPSDAASANREHYDADAAQYDREDRIELARRLTPHILAAYSFDEDKTRLLDYACGTGSSDLHFTKIPTHSNTTGLISQSLAPHTAQIVGVDISSGMVAQYNQRVADQGIPPTEMHAVVATPGSAKLADELDGGRFNVAVVRERIV
jgi:SAM-dependent methyltransferase